MLSAVAAVVAVPTVDWDFNGDGEMIGWETLAMNIIGVSLLIGAVIVIFKVVRAFSRGAKKISTLTDDLLGTDGDPKAGHPAKPGIIARMNASDENQQTILTNQNAIATTVTGLQTTVTGVQQVVGTIQSDVVAVKAEQIKAAALFQRGSDRMASQDLKIATITAELSPNHGASVKDTANLALAGVERIEVVLGDMAKERAEWQAKYEADRITEDRRRNAITVVVAKMIRMTPDAQEQLWAEFAAEYGQEHPADQ